jgi:hypothetical protein
VTTTNGYVLLYVLPRRHVDASILQSPLVLLKILTRDKPIGRGKIEANEQPEFVFRPAVGLRRVSEGFEDRRLRLPRDVFFELEKCIKSAVLYTFEKSGGYVHMGVERLFASGKFWKCRDGRFQMRSVGSSVSDQKNREC